MVELRKNLQNAMPAPYQLHYFPKIIDYDWTLLLANEKWSSLAINRISRILNFLFTLYSDFYRQKINCQKQIGFWNENSDGYISNEMHDLDVIKTALEFQNIKVI